MCCSADCRGQSDQLVARRMAAADYCVPYCAHTVIWIYSCKCNRRDFFVSLQTSARRVEAFYGLCAQCRAELFWFLIEFYYIKPY